MIILLSDLSCLIFQPFFFLYKAEKISFLVCVRVCVSVRVVVLWILHVYVIPKTWPDECCFSVGKCRQKPDTNTKILLEWFHNFSFSLLLGSLTYKLTLPMKFLVISVLVL